MKSDQYQAIACSQYDVYEIAVMRGKTLELSWLDEEGHHYQHTVKPIALNTRNGEEFLTVCIQYNHGIETTEIRLDRILTAE